MLSESDSIVLAVDLPQFNLEAGDVGTIVLVHGDDGYEVEFMTLDGEPIAITSLAADKVRPISRREIAHARSIENTAR